MTTKDTITLTREEVQHIKVAFQLSPQNKMVKTSLALLNSKPTTNKE